MGRYLVRHYSRVHGRCHTPPPTPPGALTGAADGPRKWVTGLNLPFEPEASPWVAPSCARPASLLRPPPPSPTHHARTPGWHAIESPALAVPVHRAAPRICILFVGRPSPLARPVQTQQPHAPPPALPPPTRSTQRLYSVLARWCGRGLSLFVKTRALKGLKVPTDGDAVSRLPATRVAPGLPQNWS